MSYVVNFTGLPLNAIWVANGLSVSLGKRPKPDCLEAFRVSDAARRRKVDGARTRGPHAVRYGDFDFALIPTAADGADKRKGPIAAGRILR